MHKNLNTLSIAIATLSFAGCASLQPELPQADAQIDSQWPELNGDAGAAGQNGYSVASASEIEWEQFFTDTRLKELIRLALDNNRDLRAAMLNVERARAQYRIQRADRFPAVNGTATGTRLGGDGQANVETYQAQLGVTQFELDLFGRVKSLSDAALQRYLATEEAQKSARLSLVSEIANAYLTLSADLELQRLAEATYANYEERFGISEKRNELGAVSSLELSQAKTQLASAKADVALYAGQVQRDKSALALLVGVSVSDELIPDDFNLGVSGLSPLPAQLPSEVLLRRPDIQQSEYTLRAANANLGAARAAFFPSIRLTGSVGSLSGDLSDLFSSGTDTWSFMPQVTLPIFQAGKFRANKRVAEVDRDLALTQYEKAIQVGFKEVSDALVQSQTLADRRLALEEFVASATETETLSESRYDAGVDSYLNLLDARRTLYGARQALVLSQLQEQANRVNLYKVLGGGWNAGS